MMRKLCAAAAGVLMAASARAESLPLSLAQEALTETIVACAAKGYKVAVAVVDTDGVVKIEARGDGSPIHSQRFSVRKALTAVSMGPMLGVGTTSEVIKFLTANNPAAMTNAGAGSTDLLFLPGAVVLKSKNVPIGAIGVSGAPLSIEDEACAQAGVAKIQDRLDHL